MRFRFMEDHRDEYPVKRMGKVLNVSLSGYYAWRKRPVSAREEANQALVKEIESVYHGSGGAYGSPRVYRGLKAKGILCSEKRVARLMRLRRLFSKRVRRYKVTTKRDRVYRSAPNLLRGNFRAERPNQKWLADISYIPTWEGWLYLATVLDLYSRRVVGWAMSERMTSDLTIAALKMALMQRQPASGLIHHSDQGSQYADSRYQSLLASWGIEASMNGSGAWYDNAPQESFYGTLKSELVHHRVYRTRQEAMTDVFSFIESFYNPRRLHSSLGYRSPEAYEQLYWQQHLSNSA